MYDIYAVFLCGYKVYNVYIKIVIKRVAKPNITDVREFGYGISDTYTPNIPSFYQNSSGFYNLTMSYNGSNDYQDIYQLDLGETPSLSFSYFDTDNFTVPSNINTTMTYSNLDVNEEGYYYRTYSATDGFFYQINFKIVFKVGDFSGEIFREAEKHISYSYDNSWLDQLDNYTIIDNGISKTSYIDYDDSENPIKITNFKYMDNFYNYATLNWDGRQLTNIVVYNNSLDDIAEISYTYNDKGIRIKKVVDDSLGTTTYDYKLSGSSLVAEIVNNGTNPYNNLRDLDYKIIYNYDYDDTPIGFSYIISDVIYDFLYITNLNGDVTHIIDTSGEIRVKYNYDSYGNIVSIEGADTFGDLIGEHNSLRYRSYIYDAETAFYYLQSRYYNPEISRFINADGLLGDLGNLQSHNMYAYCANNPVILQYA